MGVLTQTSGRSTVARGTGGLVGWVAGWVYSAGTVVSVCTVRNPTPCNQKRKPSILAKPHLTGNTQIIFNLLFSEQASIVSLYETSTLKRSFLRVDLAIQPKTSLYKVFGRQHLTFPGSYIHQHVYSLFKVCVSVADEAVKPITLTPPSTPLSLLLATPTSNILLVHGEVSTMMNGTHYLFKE